MDRRIAFWKSALWAAVCLIHKGDTIAAVYSQIKFSQELDFADQYDRAYFFKNN